MDNPLANIPSVDQILSRLKPEQSRLDRRYIKKLIQIEIDKIVIKSKKGEIQELYKHKLMDSISESVTKQIDMFLKPSMQRVINATGVVLHTGLGRAPLGIKDLKQLQAYASYTNLEIDMETGKRGDRLDHVEPILKLLTDCERAVVVNNNAAAVLLVLNTLTRGKCKEIIISRGEQIEIGGSFRLPDVMRNSGAKMIEIGTTNKTHLRDYARAINNKTAAVFLAHPSNFQVMGFTAKPPLSEIVTLAHQNNLPVVFDLGSGALLNMQNYNFTYEPVVGAMHHTGVDIVTFSGDKLLGGPQAGIITGNRNIINKIKRNSLLRALRCDKITLALLNQTLRKYLKTDTLQEANQTLNLLTRDLEQQENMARKIATEVRDNTNIKVEIVKNSGRVGSGAYPLADLASYSLKILVNRWPPNKIAQYFRKQPTAIIGYIRDNHFHLNMLTLFPEDMDVLCKILKEIK